MDLSEGSEDGAGLASLFKTDIGSDSSDESYIDSEGESEPDSVCRAVLEATPSFECTFGTGLVYDERMMLHEDPFDPTHPEQPARISSIYGRLKALGFTQECERVPVRRATPEELATVHSLDYCNNIDQAEEADLSTVQDIQRMYSFGSVFMNEHSVSSAKLAVGGSVDLAKGIMNGSFRNGVAIVRPPGHHAERSGAMGFCIYNTAAIVAHVASRRLGAARVVVLDWDVHHGNGTQRMFYHDDSVLYISLHRYDRGTFYPGSTDAGPHMVGGGAGKGYNINIAWDPMDEGFGDGAYLAAFDHLVMPVLREYAPDLIIISAGFDAALGDPLGGFNLTPAGYAHMTYLLSSVADGRVLMMLEGGYNLTAISNSFAACCHVLLGRPPPRLRDEDMDVGGDAWADIARARAALTPHWSCLRTPMHRLLSALLERRVDSEPLPLQTKLADPKQRSTVEQPKTAEEIAWERWERRHQTNAEGVPVVQSPVAGRFPVPSSRGVSTENRASASVSSRGVTPENRIKEERRGGSQRAESRAEAVSSNGVTPVLGIARKSAVPPSPLQRTHMHRHAPNSPSAPRGDQQKSPRSLTVQTNNLDSNSDTVSDSSADERTNLLRPQRSDLTPTRSLAAALLSPRLLAGLSPRGIGKRKSNGLQYQLLKRLNNSCVAPLSPGSRMIRRKFSLVERMHI
eukprot:Rmarinus@m.24344